MTTKDRQNQERDRIVLAACNEGRFASSRVGRYAAMYDRDPEGTTVLLTAAEDKGGLAKGSVRVRSTGPTPAEDWMLEASRARMRGDLRAAADVVASAPDPGYPVTLPAANAPREDGRYDLGTAAAPAPASSSAVAATVEVDAGGHMSCAGLPVVIAEDGAPRVVTSVGSLTVETLRTLNLDMDQERVLYASRSRMRAA